MFFCISFKTAEIGSSSPPWLWSGISDSWWMDRKISSFGFKIHDTVDQWWHQTLTTSPWIPPRNSQQKEQISSTIITLLSKTTLRMLAQVDNEAPGEKRCGNPMISQLKTSIYFGNFNASHCSSMFGDTGCLFASSHLEGVWLVKDKAAQCGVLLSGMIQECRRRSVHDERRWKHKGILQETATFLLI